MSEPVHVSALLAKDPIQFGVRGDVHLWRDMRERLSHVPLPATEEELRTIIEAMFRELTGHPISHGEEYIRLDKYDHGGMSGGLVSPEWWREKLIPLLLQRHREITGT